MRALSAHENRWIVCYRVFVTLLGDPALSLASLHLGGAASAHTYRAPSRFNPSVRIISALRPAIEHLRSRRTVSRRTLQHASMAIHRSDRYRDTVGRQPIHEGSSRCLWGHSLFFATGPQSHSASLWPSLHQGRHRARCHPTYSRCQPRPATGVTSRARHPALAATISGRPAEAQEKVKKLTRFYPKSYPLACFGIENKVF